MLGSVTIYLGRFFKQYLAFVFLLPNIYGAVIFYFFSNVGLPQLPFWVNIAFLLFALLFAGYRVWLEEYERATGLEEKAKPDWKITYREEPIEVVPDADIVKAEGDLRSFRSRLLSDPSIANSHLKPVFERNIGNFERFIKEATEYNKKAKSYSAVRFLIQNQSSQYDEQISVRAALEGSSDGKIEYFNPLGDPPKTPNFLNGIDFGLLAQQSTLLFGRRNNNEVYRDSQSLEDTSFDVTLKYIHASEEASVLGAECYVRKPASFVFHINSKNSDKEYDYRLTVE